MDNCTAYPKFEADQVLTADQLNKLFEYLDQQSRWTRKCFVGAGVACGLTVQLDQTRILLGVSGGCGLTTLGYQMKLSDTYCSHYSAYIDPVFNPFFRIEEQQVELWQLLPVGSFDSEDTDIQRLDFGFLKDKVVVLYLEVEDVDLDTCTGSDCDEKGIERTMCVRILALDKSTLDKLNQQQAATDIDALYQRHLDKYQLPELCLGRPHSLGCDDNLFNLQDIHGVYHRLLSEQKLTSILSTFRQAYALYQPLLINDFAQDPFVEYDLTFNQPLGIQYFYDHVRNLLLAYREFCQAAFDFRSLCCVPEEGFAKHLMLGMAIPAQDDTPSPYRHYFISAMASSDYQYGSDKQLKVRLMFKRLVLMLKAFAIPEYSTAQVKVTPSQEVNRPLGLRSIPYYYDTRAVPELKNIWNVERAIRYQSVIALNYFDNVGTPACEQKSTAKKPDVKGGKFGALDISRLNLDDLSLPSTDKLFALGLDSSHLSFAESAISTSYQPHLTSSDFFTTREYNPVISPGFTGPFNPLPSYPLPVNPIPVIPIPINPTPINPIPIDPVPVPRPFPQPSPNPWPFPLPTPSPFPMPVPVPTPSPFPRPIPLPGPIPGPIPGPVPGQPDNRTPVSHPLECDLAEFDFYYIQGVLGKNKNLVMGELDNWLKCYNLPIKILPLKVGELVDDSDDLPHNCRFDDIELVYQTQSQKLICYFSDALTKLRAIPFEREQVEQADSPITKVTANVSDLVSGERLTDVYYSIPELGLVSKTDSQGKLEFADLPAGNYTMETYFEGYGHKQFPINIKAGKALNLGDIELQEDALLNQESLKYKEALAEEEVRREAKKLSSSASLSYPASGALSLKLPNSLGGTPLSFDQPFVFTKPAYTSGTPVNIDYAHLSGLFAGTASSVTTKVNEPLILSDTPTVAESAASSSPFLLGSIQEKIGKAGKQDLFAAIKGNLYTNFPNIGIKQTDILLEKLHQPIELMNIISDLQEELEKPLNDFDLSYFSGKHKQQLSQTKRFIKTLEGGRYGDLITTTQRNEILQALTLLTQHSCFKPLTSLIDSYQARKRKILFMQLLSVYACKHTGMMHMGGTWSGGTYFLVYDDNQRVVLDFALPYICCSDCPPINICQGQTLIFKLPAEVFCLQDKRKFKFITNMPGGKVIGPGVSFIETTGEHYFQPSEAGVAAGMLTFTYLLEQSRYELEVLLEDPQIDIKYTLVEIDNEGQTAQVQFSAEPANSKEYQWDFGDGSSSEQASPLKTYDLNQAETFTVRLKAKVGVCYAEDELSLSFEVCNPKFSVKEVSRNAEVITYLFVHPQQVLSRRWHMGNLLDDTDSGEVDGVEIIENLAKFEYSYPRGEQSREITVTLDIKRESCQASHSETINIPGFEPINIYIERFAFCRGDTHEYIAFSPVGGVYKGNGLVVIDGDVHFYPGHPDVVLGDNVITYEYQGQRASITLTVDAIEGTFSAETKLIDGNTNKADVHFAAPDGVESASFNLGDGNVRNALSFEHQFDVSENHQFEVVARVVKGACEHEQRQLLTLKPCYADFDPVLQGSENGQAIIQYLVTEANAKEYQIEDELGSAKSAQNQFTRRYKQGAEAREIEVTISINSPPCQASLTQTVLIPAIQALSVELEKYDFVICDKKQYALLIPDDQRGGVASGRGVLQTDTGFAFSPALANAGGNHVITYTLGQQSTQISVLVRAPKAVFNLVSVKKVEDGVYDIQVQNRSIDYNASVWQIANFASSEQDSPTLRVSDVKPDQRLTVSLSVSWNNQCPSTRELLVTIPADIVNIDLSRYINVLNTLSQDNNFVEIFSPNNTAYRGSISWLEQVNKDLATPTLLNDYIVGDKVHEAAESLIPVVNSASQQLVKVAESSSELAQIGYPLLLIQLAASLELATLMEKDITSDHNFNLLLRNISQALQVLLEFGVKLDVNGELGKVLDVAKESNADKPRLLKLLDGLNVV